jgi:hypothetical protein
MPLRHIQGVFDLHSQTTTIFVVNGPAQPASSTYWRSANPLDRRFALARLSKSAQQQGPWKLNDPPLSPSYEVTAK